MFTKINNYTVTTAYNSDLLFTPMESLMRQTCFKYHQSLYFYFSWLWVHTRQLNINFIQDQDQTIEYFSSMLFHLVMYFIQIGNHYFSNKGETMKLGYSSLKYHKQMYYFNQLNLKMVMIMVTLNLKAYHYNY